MLSVRLQLSQEVTWCIFSSIVSLYFLRAVDVKNAALRVTWVCFRVVDDKHENRQWTSEE